MFFKRNLTFYFYTAILLFILQCLITILQIERCWNRLPMIIHWPPVDANIQCYSDTTDDALQSVEDPSFSPKSKSIFFHETSCRGGIDSRQACAVESAARAHPEWEVYLLFTAPVTQVMLECSCLNKLLQFPNIRLARIHANNFTEHTFVHSIFRHRLLESVQPVQHAADIMKMLTLYKWGGITIDLDVLVMKSLNNLSANWIAKESPYLLASGVMRFSKDAVGQKLTGGVLREIALTYSPYKLSHNGASAIERVLMRKCEMVMLSSGKCHGISIFGHKGFYPISFSRSIDAMSIKGPNPIDNVKSKYKKYTYCMWNVFTGQHKVHQESTYAKMAKKVCPTIYEMFGDNFGV